MEVNITNVLNVIQEVTFFKDNVMLSVQTDIMVKVDIVSNVTLPVKLVLEEIRTIVHVVILTDSYMKVNVLIPVQLVSMPHLTPLLVLHVEPVVILVTVLVKPV